MSWAKLLGLDILAAGKSSEYDFIYHPDKDVVSWRGHEKHLPGFRDIWAMGGDMGLSDRPCRNAGRFSTTHCT